MHYLNRKIRKSVRVTVPLLAFEIILILITFANGAVVGEREVISTTDAESQHANGKETTTKFSGKTTFSPHIPVNITVDTESELATTEKSVGGTVAVTTEEVIADTVANFLKTRGLTSTETVTTTDPGLSDTSTQAILITNNTENTTVRTTSSESFKTKKSKVQVTKSSSKENNHWDLDTESSTLNEIATQMMTSTPIAANTNPTIYSIPSSPKTDVDFTDPSAVTEAWLSTTMIFRRSTTALPLTTSTIAAASTSMSLNDKLESSSDTNVENTTFDFTLRDITKTYDVSTNEIRNSSVFSQEKRAKFMNDNSTNLNDLRLPSNSEAWALAGMKNRENTKDKIVAMKAKDEQAQQKKAGIITKNLADWRQIMENVEVFNKTAVDQNVDKMPNVESKQIILPEEGHDMHQKGVKNESFVLVENEVVPNIATLTPLSSTEKELHETTTSDVGVLETLSTLPSIGNHPKTNDNILEESFEAAPYNNGKQPNATTIKTEPNFTQDGNHLKGSLSVGDETTTKSIKVFMSSTLPIEIDNHNMEMVSKSSELSSPSTVDDTAIKSTTQSAMESIDVTPKSKLTSEPNESTTMQSAEHSPKATFAPSTSKSADSEDGSLDLNNFNTESSPDYDQLSHPVTITTDADLDNFDDFESTTSKSIENLDDITSSVKPSTTPVTSTASSAGLEFPATTYPIRTTSSPAEEYRTTLKLALPENSIETNSIDRTESTTEPIRAPVSHSSTLAPLHPVDNNAVDSSTIISISTHKEQEYSIHSTTESVNSGHLAKVLKPIIDSRTEPTTYNSNSPMESELDQADPDYNVIIAISVSVVGIIALILLVGFLYVMRKRQKQMSYGQRCRPVSLDAYSLDNVSVYNSVRRKGALRASKRSYGNAAFDDPSLKHNILGTHDLAKFVERKSNIYEEFRDVPQIIARADEVPQGCEDKNRYANVVPLPETRVILQRKNDDERSEYINANYIRGPKDPPNYYIACQGPLESTVSDFWRMIWEQNSRVIIMATDLIENGIEKCAEYLPPSVTLDNHTVYGDFQITLKNRDVKEKYAVSTVLIRNTVADTSREIMHFWYQWPVVGVPSDESAVIAMLLEVRSSLKAYSAEANHVKSDSDENCKAGSSDERIPLEANGNVIDKTKLSTKIQGPLTVHCSNGTGRTGTLIACDIAIRSLETPKRNVDVPQIVYYVRRGRASAIQTKEQYEFIYRVSQMYATKMSAPINDN